jgi:hypothetical protein
MVELDHLFVWVSLGRPVVVCLVAAGLTAAAGILGTC